MRVYSTLNFVIVLVSTEYTISTGQLNDEAKICAAVTTALNLPECTNQFMRNINTSATKYIEVNRKIVPEDVKDDSVLCCSLNQLQACLTGNVRTNCGLEAEKRFKAVFKDSTNSQSVMVNKRTGEIRCTYDAWYYPERVSTLLVNPWSIDTGVSDFVPLHPFMCSVENVDQSKT